MVLTREVPVTVTFSGTARLDSGQVHGGNLQLMLPPDTPFQRYEIPEGYAFRKDSEDRKVIIVRLKQDGPFSITLKGIRRIYEYRVPADGERSQALAVSRPKLPKSTPIMDYASAAFKDGMARLGLQKGPNESEAQYSERCVSFIDSRRAYVLETSEEALLVPASTLLTQNPIRTNCAGFARVMACLLLANDIPANVHVGRLLNNGGPDYDSRIATCHVVCAADLDIGPAVFDLARPRGEQIRGDTEMITLHEGMGLVLKHDPEAPTNGSGKLTVAQDFFYPTRPDLRMKYTISNMAIRVNLGIPRIISGASSPNTGRDHS